MSVNSFSEEQEAQTYQEMKTERDQGEEPGRDRGRSTDKRLCYGEYVHVLAVEVLFAHLRFFAMKLRFPPR